MLLKYKIGQTLVHLSHGIGVLKRIEERELSPGKASKFYILEILDCGVPKKVFVPVELADTKLRPVMDKKTAKAVFEYIANDKTDLEPHCTWNARYREYMELVHTGDAMQLAKVYVELRTLKAEKDLSFGELKMFEMVTDRLHKEFKAAGFVTNL